MAGEQLQPASLELRQVEAGLSELGVKSRGRHLRSSAWTGDLRGEGQGEGERPHRAQREQGLGEESEE